jgi:hypothetical protein
LINQCLTHDTDFGKDVNGDVVWLCRGFYLFEAMDACLDGGGAFDPATRQCSTAPFGQYWDVGTRATFLSWITLLGLPAALILAANATLSYLAAKATGLQRSTR